MCLHTCDYFCNKIPFNTCVTTGTAQLKSNTLLESITSWVCWQRTELKWPTEKGRGFFFIWRALQQNDGKYDQRGCTAGECEHLFDALTGSCCENCCQFGFTDIQKTCTQMEIPPRGIKLFAIRSDMKSGRRDAKIGVHERLYFKCRVHNWQRNESPCRDPV